MFPPFFENKAIFLRLVTVDGKTKLDENLYI